MSLENLFAIHDDYSATVDESGKTSWLGRVRVLATEAQRDQEYSITVAVWADSREDFDELLHAEIAARHLTLLHCDNVMPALKWLHHYPKEHFALELACGVHHSWPITFGKFSRVKSSVSEFVLKQQKSESWVEALVADFKVKLPIYCQAIGDDELHKVIKLGGERAAQYGLDQQVSRALYIYAMLCLGSHFDVDPMLPWAAQALVGEECKIEGDRVNRLRQGLSNYLGLVHGCKREYQHHFIRACLQQLREPPSPISSDKIILFIRQHYPEKYRYVGSKLLRQLIADTEVFCQQHQLNKGSSVFNLSCLRLLYGARAIEDPLFPWLQAISQKGNRIICNDRLLAEKIYQLYNSIITQVEDDCHDIFIKATLHPLKLDSELQQTNLKKKTKRARNTYADYTLF